MEWFTFDQGLILGQSIMLVVAGWLMADAARSMRRQNKRLFDALDTAKAMRDFISFQRGIIVALQVGMIGLEPIDLTNLPIEIRLKILAALIDIGVQVRLSKEKK